MENNLICCLGGEAGLVGLVVLRDVGLVSGAVYKRACALGWEVSFFSLNSAIMFLI